MCKLSTKIHIISKTKQSKNLKIQILIDTELTVNEHKYYAPILA